jgi:hypothetical protein
MTVPQETTPTGLERKAVASFRSRPEADVACAWLQSEGYDASVNSDDCSGIEPALQTPHGAQVWVQGTADELAACAEKLAGLDDEDEPGDEPRKPSVKGPVVNAGMVLLYGLLFVMLAFMTATGFGWIAG